MTTLIEKSILNERLEKSRSGIYADTSENRRKHRVGQKYGSEKKEEEKPEKTDPNKMSPEQQLEAINKVIVAVNEGKLKLPPEEINTLVAKKTMAEEAVKQAKGEKKPEKKELPKPEPTKESSGKAPEGVTQASYDSITKNAKATQRGYTLNIDGKDVRVERTIDTSGGQRTPVYQIQGMDKKYWDLDKMIEAYRKNNKESEADKEDLRAAREKLGYLQDNEERLIKRDGKEKYEERLKQAKAEVDKLKGEKLKEGTKSESTSSVLDKMETQYKENASSRKKAEEKSREISEKISKEHSEQFEKLKGNPKKEETEESYTRVKFEDVPNSGKVNLKKYLSEKVQKGVDEKWSNIKNIPTDNLKKMEKGLVNDLNKNFEAIKKSQRAELLYSIMKVKGELEKRGKESQKKE